MHLLVVSLISGSEDDHLLLRHIAHCERDAAGPYPDWRRPANGIQSVRKAVWSLIMTADASSRSAAWRATPMSCAKTLAWNATGSELAAAMASSRSRYE